MEPRVHLGKGVAFRLQETAIAEVSPQSSEKAAYLAELTLEETNTLQF